MPPVMAPSPMTAMQLLRFLPVSCLPTLMPWAALMEVDECPAPKQSNLEGDGRAHQSDRSGRKLHELSGIESLCLLNTESEEMGSKLLIASPARAETHSDSARFVNPEMPFHCRRESKRFRRPVSIL